jgi:monoamine oxidase
MEKSAGGRVRPPHHRALWLRALPVSHLCRLAFASQLANYNGCAVGRQSYLGNLAEVKGGGLERFWTESDVYHCRGGNQRLALQFAHALGPRLRLETPVTRIEVKDDQATVHSATAELLTADGVVLSGPPSVGRNVGGHSGSTGRRGCVDGFFRRTGRNRLPEALVSEPRKGLPRRLGSPLPALCGALHGGLLLGLARRPLDASGLLVSGRRTGDDRWPPPHSGLRRLHFAGEHACYKFVGYMEGALSSGVAVAGRLVAREGAPAAAPKAFPSV